MSHMLADRPIMKNYQVGKQIFWVSQKDSIWQWVAERYAGKTTKFWAAWHEAPPSDPVRAQHGYGEDKVYIFLEVPDTAKFSHNQIFEGLWSGVIFELLNMENAQGFNAVVRDAEEGRCSRRDFSLRVAELEHRALGKLQVFYKDVWLPWCKTTSFPTEEEIWKNGYHPFFKMWIHQYPAGSSYPWLFYGNAFDKIERWREERNQGQKAAPPIK